MRIAYCIGALNLGGIGTVAKNLQKYFHDQNIVLDIITTHHKGDDFESSKLEGWNLIDISNNEPSLKKRMKYLYDFLLDYSVVINNHSDELQYILPALPPEQFKLSVQHNTTDKSSKKLAYNASYLNYWAGVSPSVVDKIKIFNPNYKYPHVLPNGVLGFSYAQFRGFEKDTIRLVYVGRLDQIHKNIFTFPHIFKELEKRGYKVVFYIAGDGEHYEELKYQFNKLNQRGKVIFMGRLNTIEIEKLFHKSDFLLNTSFSEGLPMVVLESMSCGLIPILSDIGPHHYSLGTVLSHDLIGSSEISSYVNTILKLRKDEMLFKKYKDQLVNRWKDKFSIEAFGHNYKDLIENSIPNIYTQISFNQLKIPKLERYKLTKVYVLLQKLFRKV